MKRLYVRLGMVIRSWDKRFQIWNRSRQLPKVIQIEIDNKLIKEWGLYKNQDMSPIHYYLNKMFQSKKILFNFDRFTIDGVNYHMGTPYTYEKHSFIQKNKVAFKTYAEKVS